ncbi:hypothetical protein AAVH_28613 [Aphelenchoides avenae]|nr:hypothetical protein AAVH_28613 [Aphelenchus avenae]
MVAYLVVTAYASFVDDQSYQAWARQYLGWANDLICVCGSAFLFITSKDVRRGFCEFYGISWNPRSSTISPANAPFK